MLLEILIALSLGIITGYICGLTPGIHVNLVSIIVLSLSPILLQYTSPIVLCVYIVALAISQTFLDALPGIYLGAPDESQALNVLPGHRLLLKGEGHNAIIYNTGGALGALILGTILFPIFIYSMSAVSEIMNKIIGYLLIIIMIYMILRERKKWLKALLAFLISGCLGLLVFNIPNLKQPLFPLLSGLFGYSILLLSLMQKSKIPKQDLNKPVTITKKNEVKSIT